MMPLTSYTPSLQGSGATFMESQRNFGWMPFLTPPKIQVGTELRSRESINADCLNDRTSG